MTRLSLRASSDGVLDAADQLRRQGALVRGALGAQPLVHRLDFTAALANDTGAFDAEEAPGDGRCVAQHKDAGQHGPMGAKELRPQFHGRQSRGSCGNV
jgi:hypothetical protein